LLIALKHQLRRLGHAFKNVFQGFYKLLWLRLNAEISGAERMFLLVLQQRRMHSVLISHEETLKASVQDDELKNIVMWQHSYCTS
jgi:hypothetical protein